MDTRLMMQTRLVPQVHSKSPRMIKAPRKSQITEIPSSHSMVINPLLPHVSSLDELVIVS
ncbi:unnamed protein product [Brassica oleracea]